jgi:hypothetical protein
MSAGGRTVLGRRILGPAGRTHPPAHLGLAMNGGVLHAIESLSADERAAAFDGYRHIVWRLEPVEGTGRGMVRPVDRAA